MSYQVEWGGRCAHCPLHD
ncbi:MULTISPECIES: (2Fe-2S)-binding protein [Pseudomonas syringae group]|nr:MULTISPECIES: (2Fe-2S)-binding protein [Pseudomonas syringae group]